MKLILPLIAALVLTSASAASQPFMPGQGTGHRAMCIPVKTSGDPVPTSGTSGCGTWAS